MPFVIKMEFAHLPFQVIREATIVVTEFVTDLVLVENQEAAAPNLKDYVNLGKQDVDVFTEKYFQNKRADLSALLFWYAI